MADERSVWAIHDKADARFDTPSGCGWYRMVMPVTELGRHGWKTAFSAGTAPGPEVKDYRVVVGQRFDQHEVLPAWRNLKIGHRLVYELDDDIWHTLATNTIAHHVYARPDVQQVVEHCIEVADMVTVTTAPLAEIIWPFNRNVEIIPNFVPGWVLEHERPRREHVTVGWIGGASHGEDLHMIAGPVSRLLYENSNVRFHVMGTNFRPTFGMIGTRFTDWLPDPEYFTAIDFDIGLAPLTPHRFNASKSNLKALQYAALGIPVIASDAEPYRGFVTDGVTGFLCKSRPQWRAALNDLVHDRELRESMGAKAREAARSWTIEGNWQRWDEAYRKALT